MTKGPLIILSGPSGSGKSTVVQHLLDTPGLPLRRSVSATTRLPRPGERDGVDYHYWGSRQFEDEIRAGAFLEWAEVHGQRYGTLWREVEPFRGQGVGVVLVIDVNGANRVRAQCPDSVSVFLRTSSLADYEQRLLARGTEDAASLAQRLQAARKELDRAGDYHYQVINDDLEMAVARVREIVKSQF